MENCNGGRDEFYIFMLKFSKIETPIQNFSYLLRATDNVKDKINQANKKYPTKIVGLTSSGSCNEMY